MNQFVLRDDGSVNLSHRVVKGSVLFPDAESLQSGVEQRPRLRTPLRCCEVWRIDASWVNSDPKLFSLLILPPDDPRPSTHCAVRVPLKA